MPISQLPKRPPDYYTDDGPDGAPPVDLDRVQLGPFKDRAAANTTAERLRALLDVKPVLVVR